MNELGSLKIFNMTQIGNLEERLIRIRTTNKQNLYSYQQDCPIESYGLGTTGKRMIMICSSAKHSNFEEGGSN